MLRRRLVASTVLAVLGASVALACGPFFPWQLLDDRAQTLKATPVNSFVFEASHLSPAPNDKLKPVEMPDNYDYVEPWAEHLAREFAAAEAVGIPANQIPLLRAARAASSGPEALDKGNGLPLAILHYAAGAVAWHSNEYALAKTQFEFVVRLPSSAGAARVVWADYMLGRMAAAAHDGPGAERAFQASRRFAILGAPDPLGLAVASYGEEAGYIYMRPNSCWIPADARQ